MNMITDEMRGEAERIVVRGALGDLAVLAGHVPMMTTVREGVCKNVLVIGIPAALASLLMSASQILLNGRMMRYALTDERVHRLLHHLGGTHAN